MGILSSIRTYVSQLGARRDHYRTERLIRSLPSDVQKDIGWPGRASGLEAADARLRSYGRWNA